MCLKKYIRGCVSLNKYVRGCVSLKKYVGGCVSLRKKQKKLCEIEEIELVRQSCIHVTMNSENENSKDFDQEFGLWVKVSIWELVP